MKHQAPHLLSIEGMSRKQILHILNIAEQLKSMSAQDLRSLLQHFTVATLFFEKSTRTRCSFELATKRLGAHYLNLDIDHSSSAKGETLLDTLLTLKAMNCDAFIIRHAKERILNKPAKHMPNTAIINAGDGCREHPTQALLDMLTLRQAKPDFENLTVAIIGDILHSRVARSNLIALQTLGVKNIHVVAPIELTPTELRDNPNIKIFDSIEKGIQDVDVMYLLRLQLERMHADLLPNTEDFYQLFGLTKERLSLAKPDAVIMHPGPINRGVEIASEVADCSRSLILQQVQNGVLIRMAVLVALLNPTNAELLAQAGARAVTT